MKNNSVIAKNIFSFAALKSITAVFPLIVIPYLIATIGLDKYGVVIFALSFVAFFNTIVDYSFKVTAVREISLVRDSQAAINDIASKVVSTKFFLLVLSIILGTVIIFLTPAFYEELNIFLLIFSSLIGYSLNSNWFFTGIEKMEYLALFVFVLKCLHVAAIFLFIQEKSDVWIYAFIISAESLLVAILGLAFMHYKFNVKLGLTSIKSIQTQLKKNSSLFVNQLVPNLYNNTTTLLLGLFGGTMITGAYGVLRKITNLLENILGIISNVFFPAINRDKKNTKTYRKVQWTLTLFLITSIAVGAPFIIEFFNVKNDGAVTSLIILLFGIIGLTMYDIYGLNYFIVNNKDKLVFYNTLVFSVIGFALAIPTIYIGGIIGAAIIVSLTRLLIGGRLFWLYNFKKLS
jgi:PST family polysaccharide transporter